ncbi:MAG: putative Ig domain-containing protein [Pirellulales bacterium]
MNLRWQQRRRKKIERATRKRRQRDKAKSGGHPKPRRHTFSPLERRDSPGSMLILPPPLSFAAAGGLHDVTDVGAAYDVTSADDVAQQELDLLTERLTDDGDGVRPVPQDQGVDAVSQRARIHEQQLLRQRSFDATAVAPRLGQRLGDSSNASAGLFGLRDVGFAGSSAFSVGPLMEFASPLGGGIGRGSNSVSTSHPWDGFNNRFGATTSAQQAQSVQSTASYGTTSASVESVPAEGTTPQSTSTSTTSDVTTKRTSTEDLLKQTSSTFVIDRTTSFVLIGDEANELFQVAKVSSGSENVRLTLKRGATAPTDRMVDFLIERQVSGEIVSRYRMGVEFMSDGFIQRFTDARLAEATEKVSLIDSTRAGDLVSSIDVEGRLIGDTESLSLDSSLENYARLARYVAENGTDSLSSTQREELYSGLTREALAVDADALSTSDSVNYARKETLGIAAMYLGQAIVADADRLTPSLRDAATQLRDQLVDTSESYFTHWAGLDTNVEMPRVARAGGTEEYVFTLYEHGDYALDEHVSFNFGRTTAIDATIEQIGGDLTSGVSVESSSTTYDPQPLVSGISDSQSAPRISRVEINNSDEELGFYTIYPEDEVVKIGGGNPEPFIDGIFQIPWNAVDQVRVTFTTEIDPNSVGQSDLEIRDASGNLLTVDGLDDPGQGDSSTSQATWTLSSKLPDGNLLLNLSETITATASDGGESLAGWSDETPLPGTEVIPKRPLAMRLNVLGGDISTSGTVDGADYIAWGVAFESEVPWQREDTDLDGIVSGLDYLTWAGNFGASLADVLDVQLVTFDQSGSDVLIQYTGVDNSVTAFDVSVYSATSGNEVDEWQYTHRVTVPANTNPGDVRTAIFSIAGPPSFNDLIAGGEVIAVLDTGGEIVENDKENNWGVFQKTRLVEEDNLSTTDEMVNQATSTFTVPSIGAGSVRIDFSGLSFDSSSGNPSDVNDAFELAILDANGELIRDDYGDPILGTATPYSDAVFNFTEGYTPGWAAGVELLDSSGVLVENPTVNITEGAVIIDVSALAGQEIRLVARLINNDGDDTTAVNVGFNLSDPDQGTYSPQGDGSARAQEQVANESDRYQRGIDFRRLHDVTRAFEITYGTTTYQPSNIVGGDGVITARLNLNKWPSSLQPRGDLIVAINGIVDQETGESVTTNAIEFDGRLPEELAGVPAGTPYIRLTDVLPTVDDFYVRTESPRDVKLVFSHPDNRRFDYDLVVLGELNEAPSFTSAATDSIRGAAYPVDIATADTGAPTTVLEIVGNGTNTFKYRPDTTDPDYDRVTLELVTAPAGMTIENTVNGYGGTITWTPPDVAGDETFQIVVRAIDEHGYYDPANDQSFAIHVIDSTINRPPQFQTPPVTMAEVGTVYEYPAMAFDPDGDVLTYDHVDLFRPQQYVIPIGDNLELRDTINYLTFINENDGGSEGVSMYSNIRLYESDGSGEPQVLKFALTRYGSYQTASGVDGPDGSVAISGDGSVLHVTGDASKAYLLDMPYEVTENTVLAFTFASGTEGLAHGIGLDDQLSADGTGKWYQLHGSTNDGDALQDHNNYDPIWADAPDFDIDSASGEVTWNPPAELIGEWIHAELKATDPGSLTDTQAYDIIVTGDPTNHDPYLTEFPEEVFTLPFETSPASNDVTPQTGIMLDLGEGDTVTETVTITLVPSEHPAPLVDVVFLLDDTASFEDSYPPIASSLQFELIPDLLSAFPDTDIGFAVARYEDYAHVNNATTSIERPFLLNQPVIPSHKPDGSIYDFTDDYGNDTDFYDAIGRALTERTSPGYGGDPPESYIEALYQLATGVGFDGDDVPDGYLLDRPSPADQRAGDILTWAEPGDSGDVPPFSSFIPTSAIDFSIEYDNPYDDPANPPTTYNYPVPPVGTVGGVGFRDGTLPIVLLVGDNLSVYENSPEPHVVGVNGVSIPQYVFNATGRARTETPHGMGATIQMAVSALTDIGAQVIGIGNGDESWGGFDAIQGRVATFKALAELTGAINRTGMQLYSATDHVLANYWDTSIGNWNDQDDEATVDAGEPLYFDYDPDSQVDIADAVSSAIHAAVNSALFDVEVVAANGDHTLAGFEVTSVVDNISDFTVTFDVTFVGDGDPHSYDMQFLREGTSIVVGNLPVQIGGGYRYDAEAIDPDPYDVVTFELDTPSSIDSDVWSFDEATGVFEWMPQATGDYTFTIHALDGRGGHDEHTWTVTVGDTAGDNTPPTADPIADVTIEVGQEISIYATATDPDVEAGDRLHYYLTETIGGASNPLEIDRLTGEMTWTPRISQVTPQGEPYVVTVAVGDAFGGSDTTTFEITVVEPVDANNAPEFDNSVVLNKTIIAGDTYDVRALANDLDMDKLTYALPFGPAGMIVDPETGRLYWETSEVDVNTYYGTVTVRDPSFEVDTRRFKIEVISNNSDPKITSQPTGPARVDRQYTYQVEVDDKNPDTIYYAVDPVSEALGVSISSTGLLTWTPQYETFQWILVTVHDGRGGHDEQEFGLEVVPDNAAPNLSFGPADPVVLFEPWSYTVGASDEEDGVPNPAYGHDAFTIDRRSLDRGIEIHKRTGVISWTPQSSETATVLVTLTDSMGASITGTLTIPVNVPVENGNNPTQVTSEAQGPAYEGREWTYPIEVLDLDPSQTITISVESFVDAHGNAIPEGAGGYELEPYIPNLTTPVTTGSRLLRWTPPTNTAGPVEILIKAVDEFGEGQTRTVTLPVQGNLAPVFVSASGPSFINVNPIEGGPGEFQLRVIDPNGDDVHFEIVTPAPGTGSFSPAAFSSTSSDPAMPDTTTFTFTPTPGVMGHQQVTVRAIDSRGESETYTIEFTVWDSLQGSGTPGAKYSARKETAVGQLFVGQVIVDDDVDYDAKFYFLNEAGDRVNELDQITSTWGSGAVPNGLKIDHATGIVTWRPTLDDVTPIGEAPYTYTIVVDNDTDDQNGQVPIPDIELTVVTRLGNGRPEIDSDPRDATTTGSGTLEYQAHATDPDDDPVVWSLAAGPSSVSIDRLTGRFVWSPTAADTRLIQDAIIQATDPGGAFDQQRIVLDPRIFEENTAPRITSTPPQPGIGGEDYVYIVSATDDEGNPLTFTVSEPNLDVIFESPTSRRIVWHGPAANESLSFTIIVTDDRGLTDDQVVNVTIGDGTGADGKADVPPEIGNLPPLFVYVGETYSHKVTATDPDIAETGAITYSLSAVMGGTSVNTLQSAIDPVTGQITWPVNTDAGTIDVVIHATQDGTTTSQPYALQVLSATPGNSDPLLQPNNSLTAAPGQTFTFEPIVTDVDEDVPTFMLLDGDNNAVSEVDGLSITRDGRVTWVVPTGWNVNTDRAFTVYVEDGNGGSNHEDYTIDIQNDRFPTVGISASTLRPAAGDLVALWVNYADDVGVADVRLTVTPDGGQAELQAIAQNGTAVYEIPDSAPDGTVYRVQATVVDTIGNSTVSETIDLVVAPVDTSRPTVEVSAPLSGATIDVATDLIGRIVDDASLVRYSVVARPVDGGTPIYLERKDLRDSTTYDPEDVNPSMDFLYGVDNMGMHDVITTIDPLALPNGTYELEVNAVDAAGNGSSLTMTILIETEAKLGNFDVSFTDMTIPVAGIPITVQRSYDSLDANQRGDFGYGWSLDLLTGRLDFDLANNANSNPFWSSNDYAPALYNGAVHSHATWGETQGFTAVPVGLDPDGTQVGGITGLAGIYAIALEPDVGQGSRLDFTQGYGNYYPGEYQFLMARPLYDQRYNAAVVAYDPATGEFREGTTGATAGAGTPFNPANNGWNYRLSTADGSEYIFDSITGELLDFHDGYGNTLQLESGDLVSRDGEGDETGRITIIRDDAEHPGLITRVQNDLGYGVDYTYEEDTENLRFVKEEVLFEGEELTKWREWEFIYDTDPSRPHYLCEIIDPKDKTIAAVDYDSDGRLSSSGNSTDGTQTITYAPPLTGEPNGTQTVTDAFERDTVYTYDARGNVSEIRQETIAGGPYGPDALAVVWTFVHDERNRLTSQTDPEGRTTTWKYSSDGEIVEVIAPHPADTPDDELADYTTTIYYNEIGLIQSVVGPDGRGEWRWHNAQGDLTTLSDETNYLYSTWRYDDLGRLREERSEAGAFTYEYENSKYPTRITTPTDDVIDSVYDAIGQLKTFTEYDDNGMPLQNELNYDGLGRVYEAVYANGPEDLVVSYDYGEQGEEPDWTALSSDTTGPIGRHFTDTGQLAGWDLPEGGSVSYSYDRGRLDVETDQYGNQTKYHYDELGRVSKVEDLSTGAYLAYTYNLAGQVLTTKNSLGETITNTYDPDTGQLVNVQNAAGFQTQFDVTGNTATTTGPLDSMGNPITNLTRETKVISSPAGLPLRYVNADGSFTQLSYRNSDALGDAAQFPTEIIDPSGRVRSFGYADDGRLDWATDLAGIQTTFEYDDVTRRLEKVTLPEGDTVTYGYDSEGRLNSTAWSGIGERTVNTFSVDQQPENVTLPNGDTLELGYDLGTVTSRR